MKNLLKAALLAGLVSLVSSGVFAQTATTTTAESSVTVFFVTCADKAIVNLSGNMLAGFDVYYQVFNGAGGTGTALSAVRQVSVTGAYAVSDQAVYTNGATIPTGSMGSAKIYIAREGVGDAVGEASLVDTVDDAQDGCGTPQNAAANGVDVGAGAAADTTTTTELAPIYTPGGGILNPELEPEPLVVIGARQSISYRSPNAGLVFAECSNFPLRAEPGMIYDTDAVTVYWSWFAKTDAQLAEHFANANYAVRMNDAPLPGAQVNIDNPQTISRNQWLFYTVPLGYLRPGRYDVDFLLTWDAVTNDGYDDYGPGTDNVEMRASCSFTVSDNPTADSPPVNGMYNPR